ncbi:response regulator [Blastopirellula sp. JC732]|uniref:Sensory/regulatory protein RpfC n=1 Tax=Blastopirellula sediminis TaxID=2894196 RepID=A0A9X1MPB7_9BACT|nr:response regulator [Blastopirellula sediminis]MCC9606261.1 response regulator [Blastopirellula sediminis]MCC9630441.1 response regulator [Blastopirellula sediminis]
MDATDPPKKLFLRLMEAFAVGDSLPDSVRRILPWLLYEFECRFGCVTVPSDSADSRTLSAQLWHPDELVDSDEVLKRLRHQGDQNTPVEASEAVLRAFLEKGAVVETLDTTADGDAALAVVVIPVFLNDAPLLAVELFGPAEKLQGPEFESKLTDATHGLSVLAACWRRDESYQRLAQIVDSSYDAIISRDLDDTITSWNSGAEAVYGYPAEEAIGRPISILFPPTRREEEAEILEARRTGKRLTQFETERRRRDGRMISVSITTSPLCDASGRIVGVSTIERDISQRIQAERELQKAKAAAERANRARSEFLANVSHEIRTPMNAIIGMTRLSLAEELPEAVREYVETANSSAHTLLSLLNDILDFSKIESGKFTIDRSEFNLRQTIDATMRALSERAFSKGLELAIDFDSRIPDQLVGDEIRLRQIITNLVSNAVKFTERGEVLLSVKLLRRFPRDVRIRFTVSDTGVGITDADQKRIFEPFTQVDSSSTRNFGGSGLGLTICHELLQLMGGQLELKSEPGVGSRFSFSLLFPRARTAENRLRAAVLPPEFAGMQVLVVDDNETNRKILRELLRAWDLDAFTTSDAEEAIRLFREKQQVGDPFDLVLIDALMPGIDGYDLCKRLNEVAGKTPPIVLMAAPSDRYHFREREEDLPIRATLAKPITASSLHDSLVEAVSIAAPESQRTRSVEVLTSFHALRVLLVEDTAANRKLVTSLLKKRGHIVVEAHNGRESLEKFRDDDFDVILMDVQMPIMDGLQTTAAIRQIEREEDYEPTPIIAMTAHAMQGDREKCLGAGMDAYISKPIDIDDLLATLESLANDFNNHMNGENESNRIEIRPQEEPLQLEATLDRLGGDLELFRDFVEFYDEDAKALLENLADAARTKDVRRLERVAHSLKGLAGNVGGEAAATAAAKVEEAARSGNLEESQGMIASLTSELDRLAKALEPFRR